MPREVPALVRPGLPLSMEAKQRRLGRVGLLGLWARPALKALTLDLMTLSLESPVSARLAGGGREDRVAGCHCRETGMCLSRQPYFEPRKCFSLTLRCYSRAHQLRAGGGHYASSVLSSEIETTSFFDTEDNESMASSRFTTSTEATSVSRQHANRMRKQKRHTKRKQPHLSRASSISSVTDSTLSLNIITVTLNMDTVNFLGISIVGQSNQAEGGDGGIYVGSIMKGGAVALDGRIEPGDMILQVNDINFENMSNDDAVRVLRDVVQKPGPIKLVVAKCWDPHPKDYFTVPRTEPVRPIDPGAWVAHTAAVRGLELPQAPPAIPGYLGAGQHGRAPSLTTLTSSSPSLASTVQAAGQGREEAPLTVQSGMKAICSALQRPGSGLEVRDRLWLKITIPQGEIILGAS